jgi:hypothetical protein
VEGGEAAGRGKVREHGRTSAVCARIQNGPEVRRGGGRRGKGNVFFYFIKTIKHMNSNMNLNSNTPKTMQQYVCNSKLLYFII